MMLPKYMLLLGSLAAAKRLNTTSPPVANSPFIYTTITVRNPRQTHTSSEADAVTRTHTDAVTTTSTEFVTVTTTTTTTDTDTVTAPASSRASTTSTSTTSLAGPSVDLHDRRGVPQGCHLDSPPLRSSGPVYPEVYTCFDEAGTPTGTYTRWYAEHGTARTPTSPGPTPAAAASTAGEQHQHQQHRQHRRHRRDRVPPNCRSIGEPVPPIDSPWHEEVYVCRDESGRWASTFTTTIYPASPLLTFPALAPAAPPTAPAEAPATPTADSTSTVTRTVTFMA